MIFNKKWFAKYQKYLLIFANSFIGRIFFAINGDRSSVGENKIVKIEPNAIHWKNKDGSYTAEIRGHDKFGKRLYYSMYPIWWMIHQWDTLLANNIAPEYNLGFDTFTAYPAVGATSPVDGLVYRHVVGESFITIRSGAGTDVSVASFYMYDNLAGLFANTSTTNLHDYLVRSIFCFDTSTLGSKAQISSANFSVYGNYKNDSYSISNDDLTLVSSSPASTITLSPSDYDKLGSVSFGSVSFASYSISGYNDIAINSTGLSNIEKNGVSKFGLRTAFDVSGSLSYTWVSGGNMTYQGYMSDATGISKDPKLTVVYTVVEPTPSASTDGKKIIAGISGGRLYSYSGGILTEQQPDGASNVNWSSVAVSGDGTKMIAGVADGRVYIYNGTSWSLESVAGSSNGFWYSVGVSNDGSKYIAASAGGSAGGRMFTKSGNTWTEQKPAGTTDQAWERVGMSDDGNKYIASVMSGRLYVNHGSGWSEERPDGINDIRSWRPVAISGDGHKFIAGITGGRLFYFDSLKWKEIQPAGDTDKAWYSASMSADGNMFVVATNNGAGSGGGRIYVYDNGKWTEEKPAGDVDKNWYSVSMSSDGKKILASESSGRIYYNNGTYWSEITPIGSTNADWRTNLNKTPPLIYRPVRKKQYIYRVYDGASYVTSWSKEVLSVPSFRTIINGGASEIIIKLDRDFDNFNEDVDVKLNNKVEVLCVDRDSTNGSIIYTGFISGYRAVIEGNKEYIEITILPYISEMSYMMLENSSRRTEFVQNSLDPSDIITNILDEYNRQGGNVRYTGSTIGTTNTTVSYTFDANTIKEAVDKATELTPANWYWLLDADNKFYLRGADLASNTHSFYVQKHISKIETWRRAEGILNRVYFIGGDTGTGALYRVYQNTGSISAYGLHAEKMVDQRVTDASTADIMAKRAINIRKDPEIRTAITIVDNNGTSADDGVGYDIESIKPGQTFNLLNTKQSDSTLSVWDVAKWDQDVWDKTLATASVSTIQIQAVQYTPNSVTIEASSRLPTVARRIEDIKRNLESTQTLTVPIAPTVVS